MSAVAAESDEAKCALTACGEQRWRKFSSTYTTSCKVYCPCQSSLIGTIFHTQRAVARVGVGDC